MKSLNILLALIVSSSVALAGSGYGKTDDTNSTVESQAVSPSGDQSDDMKTDGDNKMDDMKEDGGQTTDDDSKGNGS